MDTANALFRMAQQLDPTQDTPHRHRRRNIRQSLGGSSSGACRGDSSPYPITRRMSI